MKKEIIRIGSKRKPKLTKKERLLTGDIQTKVKLIQALIPLEGGFGDGLDKLD